jgi:thioredoxin 1
VVRRTPKLYFLKRVPGKEFITTMAGPIIEVTDTNFQAEVIESDTAVLVDFWAPWCGPCRVVAPILEEINGEREDLRVVKLNVDDNQQTAAAFDVLSIPTLILFRNGQIAKKVIGALPKKRLEAELEPALA